VKYFDLVGLEFQVRRQLLAQPPEGGHTLREDDGAFRTAGTDTNALEVLEQLRVLGGRGIQRRARKLLEAFERVTLDLLRGSVVAQPLDSFSHRLTEGGG